MKICRVTFKIVILQVEIKHGKQRKALKKDNVLCHFKLTVHYWGFKCFYFGF